MRARNRGGRGSTDFPESDGKTELMSPAGFVDDVAAVVALRMNDSGIRFAGAIFSES